jgi:hypothetical protein
MLTDDEIRAIHDGRIDESYHHGHMQEICTRLLSAEAKVRELEKAERAAYERGRQDASPTLGISPLR